MKLYIVRHGECTKNLVGVPGGAGAQLTPRGVGQVRDLAARLKLLDEVPGSISACPPVQTRETAEILAECLNLHTCTTEELRSIDLGVLTGVPIDLARRLHPVSSASMDLWRAGQIELCDVAIEGMERPLDFFLRGLKYLLKCATRDLPELVVATTSLMILFENLHQMKGPERGEGYRSREYKHCELLNLHFGTAQLEWLHSKADAHGLV